jgi:hypothetical protein
MVGIIPASVGLGTARLTAAERRRMRGTARLTAPGGDVVGGATSVRGWLPVEVSIQQCLTGEVAEDAERRSPEIGSAGRMSRLNPSFRRTLLPVTRSTLLRVME